MRNCVTAASSIHHMSTLFSAIYDVSRHRRNDFQTRSMLQICNTCVTVPNRRRRCRHFRTAIVVIAFWNVIRLLYVLNSSHLQNNSIQLKDISSEGRTRTNNMCRVPTAQRHEIPREVRLDPVELERVEKEIFQESYDLIKTNTIRVNSLLQERHIRVEKERTTIRELSDHLTDAIKVNDYMYFPGGHWRPGTCSPRWKVAIVIPYKDRQLNLHVLLRNLVPFLLKQQLEFGIFITQQNTSGKMNRGMTKNVGYVEANKFFTWDCVIFHDIDHVPVNDSNYYGCQDFPRHFAVHDEDTQYKLLYDDIFGGVVGLTNEQMMRVNGYPNVYWGWGGEDDELRLRVVSHGFNISRPGRAGFYRTLPHEKHRRKDECDERYCYMYTYKNRLLSDGLKNLKYPKPTVTLETLYIKVTADIAPVAWQPSWGNVCERVTSRFIFSVLTLVERIWRIVIW